MNVWKTLRSAALAVTVVGTWACGPEAVEAPAESERGGGGAITIWTERTELFFEHPALIAGAPGEPWAIHLTDLADFRAVSVGRLTLEFVGADGRAHTTVAEAPARAGVYNPAPSLPTAGTYDLTMRLESEHLSDEIHVGSIRVFASEADLPVPDAAGGAGISFLKEQQWPIDFATAPAGSRVVSPGLEVTGSLEPAPGRMAQVTAPVDGIARWDLNRDAPTEGAWVRAGQPMVRLAPVGGADAYASLRGRAELLEREVARAERLVAAQAIPARRLDEARLELDVVQAQLSALDAGERDGFVLALPAPIDGSVVERRFVAGQRVDAGAHLLTVLDPRQLHLVLQVPAGDLAALEGVSGATFTPEGAQDVVRTERLVSVGAALDPALRTVPVTFVVDNPDRRLRSGMLVTGRLLSGERAPALAIPAQAVVDEDGVMVAYVQAGGETFERRVVTVGASDGEWTVVTDGVRAGERVVTRGQYQIRLSSLNTSEIADHGHAH
ncbi:MAG TPA: efflux RND transporter periplasmic adaptor subunit [Longimicrobiales bacterium]|nr:efflux RND transporter periplasmic adaptor subunit [Longimicrobiales bacterium]